MKKNNAQIRFIYLVIMISIKAYAGVEVSTPTNSNRPVETSFIQSMSSYGQKLLPFLPGDLGKAVTTYIEVMQPNRYSNDNVREANFGLRQSNNENFQNSCEAQLLRKLYYSPEVNNVKKTPITILDTKPESLKPGWLWNKSLVLADGNPNLAIKMIAFCGHDDVSQTDRTVDVPCPAEKADFYSHQTLGEKVDIDQKIKNYVVEKQSIHVDANKIKAKNYHIYGGALLGCKMIENGIPKEKVANYAQMFSYLYRRIALCRASQSRIADFKEVIDTYERSLKEYNSSTNEKATPPNLVASLKKTIESKRSTQFYKYPYLKTEEERKNFLEKTVTAFQASKYYVKETNCPTGTTSEFSEGLSLLTSSSNLSNNNLSMGTNNYQQFIERCENLIGGNCDKVEKHLLTWDADFKWTMSQHKIGAQFAAENCSAKKEVYNKRPKICETEQQATSVEPDYKKIEPKSKFDDTKDIKKINTSQ